VPLETESPDEFVFPAGMRVWAGRGCLPHPEGPGKQKGRKALNHQRRQRHCYVWHGSSPFARKRRVHVEVTQTGTGNAASASPEGPGREAWAAGRVPGAADRFRRLTLFG